MKRTLVYLAVRALIYRMRPSTYAFEDPFLSRAEPGWLMRYVKA